MKIITNHHWRDFISGYELPENVLADFDWLEDPLEEPDFIYYRGNYYHLSEFTRISLYWGTEVEGLRDEWDAIATDSFFSGVVIRLDDYGEQYKIGLALS